MEQMKWTVGTARHQDHEMLKRPQEVRQIHKPFQKTAQEAAMLSDPTPERRSLIIAQEE